MNKKITVTFLNSKNACKSGMDYVTTNDYIGLKTIPFIEKLIKEDMLNWANWLIVRCMSYKQYVAYAIYAAEHVIDSFEKKYTNDKRPRQAIEAAKLCLKAPTKKNKADAADAAAAAAAAADGYAAAYAAYAAYAAAYAAYAAADAADAASKKKMKIKILKYGLKLLK